MRDTLAELQIWYANACNGEWEHQYGISIESLDNPGWSVKIDLSETDLAGKVFARTEIERAEHNWVQCWVEEGVFQGRGGPKNLEDILFVFTRWILLREATETK